MPRNTSRSVATTESRASFGELSIQYQPLTALRPHPNNSRKHPKRQIRQLAANIQQFGFTSPILVDSGNTVIAGHARCEAAKQAGMNRVPTIRLQDLSPDQVRALMIADNRLTETADWDFSILAIELQHLGSLEDFDISLTGFELPEIDFIIDGSSEKAAEPDEVIDFDGFPAVTRNGDGWTLGGHHLICGSSLQESTFRTLMGRRRANVVFADPPYNVRIDGNVCGKGSIHHREFAMASGEMNEAEFVQFLTTSLGMLALFSTPGSAHFICMDWRHAGELLEAAKRCDEELLNMCVWVKTNGGMGSLYRSQHELVFVVRNGKGRHRNNIQLGRYGRNRTNVWNYPGVNTLSKIDEQGKLLALHPTVKPIALVADALLDCSIRGELVLDGFLGSGTTLLAAERVGRRCYGIEIDALYVDVAVRRWQSLTGEHAIHQSGKSFEDLTESRTHVAESSPNNDI
jgi:DNA modification methylase